MRRVLALMALLLLPVLAHAAQVQASLDRNQVQLGDTVTLNLRVEGGGMAQAPDLSSLASDFEVLGRSSSTSVRIVNGRRSVQYTVGIALRPRRVGQLVIPALDFAGARTRPLTLTVTAPDPAAAVNSGKDVFLEASAQPTTVRVGQQLLFTVRLYFAGSLSSGSLEDPRLSGIDARRLGDDLDYDVVRAGRAYHVIERRYALIPQHAGTIELPSLSFQGELIDPSDPDSFFAMGSPTTAASPAITINVEPVPPHWGASAWLPARALSLTLEGLPADGKLHVGQPLDLAMTVQATGLPYEALPALSLPDLPGATVYPDKPVTATRNDGQWLVGRRQQNFAVVPGRPGKFTLPAITLKWWNVQTGQAEEARIPAHTLTVLPGAGAAAAPAAPMPSAAASAVAAEASTATAPAPARLPAWRTAVLVAVALLLACGALAAWWAWRHRARTQASAPVAHSHRALRLAFLAAARGSDAGRQAHALLAWARAERAALGSLGALADALASDGQREAIEQLQRRRFAAGESGPAPDLAAAFRRGFQWRAPASGDEPPVPPLYPFKLR
ncbi:BatD family protein [Frateuria hangzhouensis]|uniref:BatD family protein n=1 Tax=Frateuria hangzhouensis TaxID=2995589 RepID=UPI002260AF4C|nr:BatD family protein [Frateuria sp. STR12]MCX7515071.1 BatD family protein [Frateuria sp. STR12]